MQLRHFRYFIAVAEEGSFLRGARRLRVAQSSLSRQIQDLEREIGVPLFERVPRGVKLTEAGAAFLIEARGTVENAARAVARARRADVDSVHTILVAHSALFHLSHVVANLLAAFRTAHSDVAVKVRRVSEVDQPAALREQRVDVGTMFLGQPSLDGFRVHLLVKQPATGVLIPAAHPLAAKDVVSLPELRELTLMHVDARNSPEIYETVMAALVGRGLKPAHRKTRPRDPATAIIEIAAGATWMLTSEEAAKQFLDRNSAVVYRRFVEPPIPFWLGLVWRQDPPFESVERLVRVACDIGMNALAD